jgi:hypothetical protein
VKRGGAAAAHSAAQRQRTEAEKLAKRGGCRMFQRERGEGGREGERGCREEGKEGRRD